MLAATLGVAVLCVIFGILAFIPVTISERAADLLLGGGVPR